ncbi:hypothetical protein HS125_05190 [bacterium]|nr:hypothetical protein [bacterium]
MTCIGRILVGLVVGWMLAGPAGAVTIALELVKFEQSPALLRAGDATAVERLAAGMARGQAMPLTVEEGKIAVDPAYSQVVRKEPAGLICAQPLRGVLKIGESAFGYIFDSTDLAESGFHRLYFDRNGDGDLSDETPLEAIPVRRGVSGPLARPVTTGARVAPTTAAPARFVPSPAYNYTSANFPPLDMQVRSGGKTLDYRVWPYVYATFTSGDDAQLRSGGVTFRPGGYRKGQVELGGRRMMVVLVDSNGNGAFNDPLVFQAMGADAAGRVRPVFGDALVVAEEDSLAAMRTTLLGLRDGLHVTPLYRVGETLYDLSVSPSGEAVTLAPSRVATGRVRCPGKSFSGVLFSELGFVNLVAVEGEAVEVPAGEWKLYQYTLDMATQEAAGGATVPVAGTRNYTRVSAVGTRESPPVKVERGRTTTLPYGGPYKTVVHAAPGSAPKDAPPGDYAQLSLSLVGKGGEVLTGLYLNGRRPAAPTFVVADSRGKKIDAGAFQFG